MINICLIAMHATGMKLTNKTVNMLEGKYQVGPLHSPAGEVQSGCLITFTVRIIGTFTGTSTASFKTVMGHY